ncbi:aminotransferase class V-fold PLP-dependent enzyme [Pseudoduganella namucuonensis]|uniref:cysteine desulfurase n=1 Tax=Pseudoduganella namucuonensis TaxID=1035707 RepID=A0A1I7GYM9_9BURK|nr:aminotransferase class V-fold PLP-dependent enzyme [Pseudoduganella namucuonensis]SFU53574.1 Cysteine sulfinate desulfinase/cysteine desulfurase [Pseudoduganella namucuonensis]
MTMSAIAYFDNNATTPMCHGAVAALADATPVFGNPSSASTLAKSAKHLVAAARVYVAALLGADTDEVVFTSGGTESNNWAIKGAICKRLVSGERPGHVIVSAIEHASVLQVAEYLERVLRYDVTRVQPGRDGVVDAAAVEAALRPDTHLVSVMLVNNEVGTIQPVREIAELLRHTGIHFHVDGVQGIGKVAVDVHELEVDTLSLSAHKFHGPKGVGALYVRRGVALEPLLHGGSQEGGLRGGTEAVPLIASMGAAAKEAQERLPHYQRQVGARRAALRARLLERVPGCAFNGPADDARVAPNTLSLRVDGIRAEAAAALLDQKYGIQVSLGSACSNNKAVSLSHVLSAMGMGEEQIKSTMRVSIGYATTERDVEHFVASLGSVVELLRRISPKPSAPPALPLDGAASILHCLEHYAASQADAAAYVFLADGDRKEQRLTYAQLRGRALRFAAMLDSRRLKGKAALMLYPSGLEFVVAFFGCLYAGVVAVPANHARNSHHFLRLRHIIANCEAAAVLTTEALRGAVKSGILASGVEEQAVLFLTEPAGDAPAAFDVVLPDGGARAFLQYTSGSTGQPKGVIVTHGQLIANERAIQRCGGLPERAAVGGWLPQYHDMGLIGTTLQPIALGGCYTFMQPLHFLHRPTRWLEMIATHRIQTTAVPNFALDMCVRVAEENIPAGLDLSSLRAIFCGAEPVNADTVARFQQRYAPYGLRADVLQPCYGLAEATLIVSGGATEPAMRTVHVSRQQLLEGQLAVLPEGGAGSQPIVCCGKVVPGHEVAIVDPQTCAELGADALGEIWVAGPSVASGYLGNEAGTAATFQAMTGAGRGPFMRTGDLGFVHQGGLYVTGRIKELMIIRGRNFYPHDIEATITACLRQHGEVATAVFHPEERDAKGLVVMVELGRRGKLDIGFERAAGSLRQVISEAHELSVRDVFFVGSGGIPRTSSGKIQRHRCEALYLNGDLNQSETKLFSTRDAGPLAAA